MAKFPGGALKLVRLEGRSSRSDALNMKLNNRVLETLSDLKLSCEEDPGIEDEYEAEIFGKPPPRKSTHKRK